MSDVLQVFAGEHAYRWIQDKGLAPADIRVLLGASGGPKWFVLCALDQYLARHWLPAIDHPIDMIGSSIGAWRMAALAQEDADQAIVRLADDYRQMAFEPGASVEEVTAAIERMVKILLGERRFVANRHLHIVTARCKGLTRVENRWLQSLAFASVASANLIHRKSLRRFFERVVFHSEPARKSLTRHGDFRTHHVPLTPDNLEQALLASGAIPVVIRGVTDPLGAPPGTYRDGGMVDYHFDLPLHPRNGLVLYPHFAPLLKPGWFDKPLKHRKVLARHYSHTVLITPSPSFIEQLPFSKIPDRKDFTRLSNPDRLRYWQQVIAQSERLAEAWHEMTASGELKARLKPLERSGLVRQY